MFFDTKKLKLKGKAFPFVLCCFGTVISKIAISYKFKLNTMKKILGVVLIAASLAACNNQYKASSEERADSIKMMKDSLTLDSFKRVETAKVEAEKEQAAVAAAAATASKTTVVNHYNTTTTTTTAQPQKKGWSSAAKGAVIGGAAGAVGGALIDNKKGRGALIGGAAGAGAGYLIGRDKDKKTGRAD